MRHSCKPRKSIAIFRENKASLSYPYPTDAFKVFYIFQNLSIRRTMKNASDDNAHHLRFLLYILFFNLT
jgi:hypothetical protein